MEGWMGGGEGRLRDGGVKEMEGWKNGGRSERMGRKMDGWRGGGMVGWREIGVKG